MVINIQSLICIDGLCCPGDDKRLAAQMIRAYKNRFSGLTPQSILVHNVTWGKEQPDNILTTAAVWDKTICSRLHDAIQAVNRIPFDLHEPQHAQLRRMACIADNQPVADGPFLLFNMPTRTGTTWCFETVLGPARMGAIEANPERFASAIIQLI